jgi:hypothetical protein
MAAIVVGLIGLLGLIGLWLLACHEEKHGQGCPHCGSRYVRKASEADWQCRECMGFFPDKDLGKLHENSGRTDWASRN